MSLLSVRFQEEACLFSHWLSGGRCADAQVEEFDDGSGHLDMQEFKLCAAGLNLPIGREARARVRLLAYKQCIDPASIQVDFARALHARGTMD